MEIFYQGKRVASHARSSKPRKHTTINEHRPKSHQRYLEWTPSRIIDWAATVGSFTARLVEALIAAKPHVEMGYRSAVGVIRLSDRYGKARMEAACARALQLKVCSYKSVKSIWNANWIVNPYLNLCRSFHPWSMRTFAVPITMPARRTNRRWAHVKTSHPRQTAGAEADRHGHGL